MPASGATPPQAEGETQAAHWVQRMFADVAPRYDLLNHLLSFNIDRRWRGALVSELLPILRDRHKRVLDLCCGTGDVLLALKQEARCFLLGADFCHPMLVASAAKAEARKWTAPLLEADALSMPLSNDSVDGIAISFGFRNLANYRAGLSELFRILKPGGTVAILEFSHPPGAAMRFAYGLYSRLLLPLIGSLLSPSREAYSYLPASIRQFPGAPELVRMMVEAGFASARYSLLTGGIAALHCGTKPSTNQDGAKADPKR